MDGKRLNQLGAGALAQVLASSTLAKKVASPLKTQINMMALMALAAGAVNMGLSPDAKAGSTSEARAVGWGISAVMGAVNRSTTALVAGGALGEVANAVSNNDNRMWATGVAALLGSAAGANVDIKERQMREFQQNQMKNGGSSSGAANGPYSKNMAQLTLDNGGEIFYSLDGTIYVGTHNSPTFLLINNSYADGKTEAPSHVKEAINSACSKAFGSYHNLVQSINNFTMVYNQQTGLLANTSNDNKYSGSYEEYQKKQAYMARAGASAQSEIVRASQLADGSYIDYKKASGLCVRMTDQALADGFAVTPVLQETAANYAQQNNFSAEEVSFKKMLETPKAYGTINTILKKKPVNSFPKLTRF